MLWPWRTRSRRSPAFDPGGRGANPVNLIKDAAERYGYILVASNNSRNGALKPEAEAAQAVWTDTHQRIAIDDKQVAFAGHSGGARLAAWVAQSCKCGHGLLLNGAGYPLAFPPTKETAIPIFAVVGMLDFNYAEMVELDTKLDSLRYPHFLRRWDGPHAWAPAEVWDEALAWLELTAIKQGRRPSDANFVATELARATDRASKLEQSDSTYFAWENYREAAATFAGLADTTALNDRAAALAKLPAVRNGQSNEKKETDERQSLLSDIERLAGGRADDPAGDFDAGELVGGNQRTVGSGANPNTVKEDALRKIRQLRDELAKERDPERLRSLQRTQTGVALFVADAGNTLMQMKQYPAARTQFELAVATQPERARSHVALARSILAMGDRAEALRALERARAAGVSASDLRDASRNVPEFDALAGDPKFQQLMETS